VQPIVCDINFEEDQEGELSHAFRSERVGVPSSGDARALPDESSGGCDHPFEGSSVVFCAAVGAEEESIAIQEVLA
jgi:hypothetical protein